MMSGYLEAFITCAIFFIIGVTCLLFPEKIQKLGAKYSGQGLGKYNPFNQWVKIGNYLIMIRILGVVAVTVSILFLYVILKYRQ